MKILVQPESKRPKFSIGDGPTIAFLGLLCFLAHFLLSSHFGIYEDDYFYTLPPLSWDLSSWWSQLKEAIIHPVQGRPLNHAVRRALFYVALHNGGLQTAYWVSWGMITLNAVLLYFLVRRLLSCPAALVAAVSYLVYPIDTARQLLMHQTDLHFGAGLVLLSLNLYASGRRVTAWSIAAIGLLNYEAFYLPFVAAPLLVNRGSRPEWRSWLRHGLWFVVVAGSVVYLRGKLGESRANELMAGFGGIVAKSLIAAATGVLESTRAAFARPVDAFMHAPPYAWAIGLAVTAALLALLRRPDHESTADASVAKYSRSHAGWLAVGGLVAWAASYGLAFRDDYFPPVVSIGRLTGVHSAGAIGAALVAAAAAEAVRMQSRRWLRLVSGWLFAPLAGFATSFAVQVQETEYVAHWNEQVSFYRSLFALVPDLKPGELVVLDVEGDEHAYPITKGFPRFGVVNYSPLAFQYFLSPLAGQNKPPQLVALWRDVPMTPTEDGLAVFSPPWRYQPRPAAALAGLSDMPPILRNDRFVYITVANGQLERQHGRVNIYGHELTARAAEGGVPLKTSPLFQRLTAPTSPDNWFTLVKARNYPR